MRAIQLIESIPRYVLTKAVGAVYRPVFWSPLAMLQYREVPEPALPGPQWVRIKTHYGGICFTVVAIYDPRYREPWLLACPLKLSGNYSMVLC
jgi:hypothetical protein